MAYDHDYDQAELQETLEDYFASYNGSDYYYDLSPEAAAAATIYLYISPIWLALGTVLNIVSSVVLYRLGTEVFSTCLYLVVGAWADLVVLYIRCGNEWLMHVAAVDVSTKLMTESESVCKVLPFAINFSFHLSRWLIVCCAVEGCIATVCPHKVPQLCNKSRAQAVMLLITVLLICLNIHYFWSFELLDDPNLVPFKMCTFIRFGYHYSEVFQTIVFPMMNLLLGELVPHLIMLISVVIMIVQIARRRHHGSAEYQQWRKRYELCPDDLDQLKVTILATCCFVLVLEIPKFGYSFISDMQMSRGSEISRAVLDTLHYCDLSLKFFVYVTTSEKFRKTLKDFLTMKCRKHYSTLNNDPNSCTP